MAVGAEAIFGESLITTKLDSAISWARESSMWPYVLEPPVVPSNL